MLALSDGVFAIIITLLVLEIHVPELARGQSLSHALREVRPSFVSFLITFVVVAISWAGHRDLFSLIRRTDRALVWFNIVYLLPLCVLPFGASLLARYEEEPVALQMYGLMLLAGSIARLAIWVYATGRPHLLYVQMDSISRRNGALVVVLHGAAYAVAILVADSSPSASLIIYAAVPILYFVGITLLRTSAPAGSAEREFT